MRCLWHTSWNRQALSSLNNAVIHFSPWRQARKNFSQIFLASAWISHVINAIFDCFRWQACPTYLVDWSLQSITTQSLKTVKFPSWLCGSPDVAEFSTSKAQPLLFYPPVQQGLKHGKWRGNANESRVPRFIPGLRWANGLPCFKECLNVDSSPPRPIIAWCRERTVAFFWSYGIRFQRLNTPFCSGILDITTIAVFSRSQVISCLRMLIKRNVVVFLLLCISIPKQFNTDCVFCASISDPSSARVPSRQCIHAVTQYLAW